MLTVPLLAAATANNDFVMQLILLGLGWLLGVLFLGLCELCYLGYLKFRELRHLWVAPRPAPEPEDDCFTDPEPPAAESRQPVTQRSHLRVVASRPPAATRNGQQPDAQAALQRNAGDTRRA